MKLFLTMMLVAGSLQTQDHHGQLKARGDHAMGFDQAKTTHHFYLYHDGGAIEVTVNDPKDMANLSAIRTHLPHIAKMFGAGDFSIPHFVHDDKVAGTDAMKRLRERIVYNYQDIADGGRVRITTADGHALTAVHEFLRYQIADHKTGDSTQVQRAP